MENSQRILTYPNAGICHVVTCGNPIGRKGRERITLSRKCLEALDMNVPSLYEFELERRILKKIDEGGKDGKKKKTSTYDTPITSRRTRSDKSIASIVSKKIFGESNVNSTSRSGESREEESTTPADVRREERAQSVQRNCRGKENRTYNSRTSPEEVETSTILSKSVVPVPPPVAVDQFQPGMTMERAKYFTKNTAEDETKKSETDVEEADSAEPTCSIFQCGWF